MHSHNPFKLYHLYLTYTERNRDLQIAIFAVAMASLVLTQLKIHQPRLKLRNSTKSLIHDLALSKKYYLVFQNMTIVPTAVRCLQAMMILVRC